MADDTSNDLSERMTELASRSKEAGKKMASKGKEIASKGYQGGKSAAQNLSKKGHDFIENRKEKTSKNSVSTEFEVTPLDENIPVQEGAEIVYSLDEDYSKYTVNELKIRLKFLGLRVAGKKAALIERLKSSRKGKQNQEESSVLDELEIKIQTIEEEYPEVLKPIPPNKEVMTVQFWHNSLYNICGFTFLFYSFLLLLPTVLSGRLGDSILGLPFVELFLPTWFSPDHIQPLTANLHVPFVIIGSLVVVLSGILLLRKNNFAPTLLASYFIGVLLIGRLVFFFQSDSTMVSEDYSNFLHDLFLTFLVCGFAFLPQAFHQLVNSETSLKLSQYVGESAISTENPNSHAHLEQIIQEGLNMDFRAEVAKPKPPRARAKFEAYEKILLVFGIPTWFFSVALTLSYDNGLITWVEYSASVPSLVAVWVISSFILIALVRFDRAARGNGWYAKEKETYVGLMDLYNKAQAKHYEYVELRAAAEAQEIMEKYPQLDNPKSGSLSKA